jgi:uncharacterized protein YndB with AHSA1/START domain
MGKKITIEANIKGDIQKIWDMWTLPQDIINWAFASDDWEAPKSENDLHVGGRFLTTMRAKDGSVSFDFTGTYTKIEDKKLIEYKIDDGRMVSTTFTPTDEGVHIEGTFEMEDDNTEELQRAGWQAILNNFKRYAESK